MTREEFADLQHRHQESGMSLKEYLLESGISYSMYTYWRRKFCLCPDESHELVPISFIAGSRPLTVFSSSSDAVPSGTTLLFPNGLRAHFGSGMEGVLMDLLEKSLSSHVLP